ncbi:MAG TPA: 50S ribosomal protein L22 [Firmicutes bacterium]|nr:50S ribosomal protein L22 [Bacillota bacterium]
MEYRAIARYVRMAPRKAGLVARLVRSKPCDEAQAILKFTPNKPARHILKALNSAIANAADRSNGQLSAEDLFVKHISIDGATPMRRVRPLSRGRAAIIRKTSSHINVIVAERQPSNEE